MTDNVVKCAPGIWSHETEMWHDGSDRKASCNRFINDKLWSGEEKQDGRWKIVTEQKMSRDEALLWVSSGVPSWLRSMDSSVQTALLALDAKIDQQKREISLAIQTAEKAIADVIAAAKRDDLVVYQSIDGPVIHASCRQYTAESLKEALAPSLELLRKVSGSAGSYDGPWHYVLRAKFDDVKTSTADGDGKLTHIYLG